MIEKYLELEKQLKLVREKNNNVETDEEDDLLDQMDAIWYNMTKEEIEFLNQRFDL